MFKLKLRIFTKISLLDKKGIKSLLVILLVLIIFLVQNVSAQDLKAKQHEITRGETLYGISKLYSISVEQIMSWNGLVSNSIKVGQKLIVGYEARAKKEGGSKSAYKEALGKLVEDVQGLYFSVLNANKNPEQSYERVFMRSLITDFEETNFSSDALSDLNIELIEALKADVGLDFYSSAVYNFEPGISETEDLFFRSRVNAGIDWQILKSGLVGNKRKIRELEIQNQINQLITLKSKKESQYVYLYNYIIYLFNKRQLDYVRQRIEIIDSFLSISNQMYLVRATRWEDIVELRNRKETLSNIQRNLSKYNTGFERTYSQMGFNEDVNVDKLPILELDAQRIFQGIQFDSLDTQMNELLKEQLTYKYNRSKDMSLRAYMRYNLYTNAETIGQSIRTFGAVGATFNAPLFQNNNNRQIAEKELAYIQSEAERRQTEVNNSLLNQYYEYEYVFKSYMEFFGDKGVVFERLRRELIKDDMNDLSFSPLNAIHQIDQIYAIETDLLDIKQNLYLKLLRIYTDMNLDNLGQIAEEVLLDGFFDKTSGERSLYIWSNGFNRFSPQFLSNYIANNGFINLYLSPGAAEQERLGGFLKRENLQKVSIYRLVGENSYAIDGNAQGLLNIIGEVNSSEYKGIQLDIEPHTLDDWDENMEVYLNNLIQVTKQARKALNSSKSVSISIPNFYPESAIEALGELVDEIVVMSYGRAEIDFVIRKLEEERRIASDKLVVAFRAQDFKDRVVMEDFILDFIQKTGIENIAIHDLENLIVLDQKTISGN